jgi:preprotein translocase subunit SecF
MEGEQVENKESKGSGSIVKNAAQFYDKNYKKLLAIPALIILAAVLLLVATFASTGSFFNKDVTLSGGVSVTAVTDFSDVVELDQELSNMFPSQDIGVRRITEFSKTTGIVVESNMQSEKDIDQLISFLSSRLSIDKDDFSVQKVGSSLGQSFFKQLIMGLGLAFLFMAVTVFGYFRITTGKWLWLPGTFVVWTVFVDMICVLAVIAVSGINLSVAGLAAFLMLIGYSVDTDILLTTRALKGSEAKVSERIASAAKTGILMTTAGLAAVVAGFFFAESETIKQIMFVLSVGLVFDLIHTWLTNAGLLRWYLERRGMV